MHASSYFWACQLSEDVIIHVRAELVRRRLEGLLGAWRLAFWVLYVINNVTVLQYHKANLASSRPPPSLAIPATTPQLRRLSQLLGVVIVSRAPFSLKPESRPSELPPLTLYLAPFSLGCGPPTSSFHCTTASSSILAASSAIPSTLLNIFGRQ